MRSHSQLDTRFHHLGRRFTAIVNHADGDLVTHEHTGFRIVKRRNLRAGEHFRRSITHQVRNSNLKIVVEEACRNGCTRITHGRRCSVRERLDSATDSAGTRCSTRCSRCSSWSKRSRPHGSRPIDAQFAGKFAVHDHEFCGNHNLQRFDIKFGEGVSHLFNAAVRIINDDGVRAFHDRNLAAVRLHVIKNLDEFIGLGMVNLEVLTNKRCILFCLFFFIGKFLLFGLVSALALDRNVLVLNHPREVIHVTNNVQRLLPSFLGHAQAYLTLDIRSHQDIHASND